MAKKSAKRTKVIRKKPVSPPKGGSRKSGAAPGMTAFAGGGVSLTDVPASDVGSVVQGMVNHGASDIRSTQQPNGLWTVGKMA